MQPESRASRPESGRRSAIRLRRSTLMMAVLVVGVWLGMLTLPGVGPMLGSILALLAGAAAILGVAMGLGWVGFRLFAAFDRLASWSGRGPEWFHPDPEDEPGTPR